MWWSHPSLLQIQGVEMQTWHCTVWWISRGSNHDISKSEKPPEVPGELLVWTDKISFSFPANLVRHRPGASCTCRRLPLWTVLFDFQGGGTCLIQNSHPIQIGGISLHGSFSGHETLLDTEGLEGLIWGVGLNGNQHMLVYMFSCNDQP